ncbi:MAG: hypothetical protein R3C17_02405 [Planctomycetaceae bacterium]
MSIRFVRQAAVFGLITVLISAFGQAQPPGGGRGGFGGFGGGRGGFNIDRATLLRADQVRKELKIEEAQAATIDAALEAYREEQRGNSPRPDRDALAQMSEEERTKLFEKFQKDREELSKKTDEVLSALLEPDQAKRLDQISLQAKLMFSTVQTLKSDELKSKLSLTDEQVAKLEDVEKTAIADMQAQFQELRAAGGGGGRGGFEQMQEKMSAARAKTSETAMAVLTADQVTTLNELRGPEFKVEMRTLMGGRGGFGGPPGGGDRRRGGDGGGGSGRRTRPPAE